MRIHSIFESISGEAGVLIPQGLYCTFIRLQGCNLRCRWCDTKVTQPNVGVGSGAAIITIDEIVKKVETESVIITGGEPLVQSKELIELIDLLESKNKSVQVETNGSIAIPRDRLTCGWVIDYKCPSSGMVDQMLPMSEIATMTFENESMIKFVIDLEYNNEEDFDFTRERIDDFVRLGYFGYFIISPANASPKALQYMVEKMAEHKYKYRDQIICSLQMHKLCNLP